MAGIYDQNKGWGDFLGSRNSQPGMSPGFPPPMQGSQFPMPGQNPGPFQGPFPVPGRQPMSTPRPQMPQQPPYGPTGPFIPRSPGGPVGPMPSREAATMPPWAQRFPQLWLFLQNLQRKQPAPAGSNVPVGVGLPGYAQGGIAGMNGPEVAQLGEQGPEAVIPLAPPGGDMMGGGAAGMGDGQSQILMMLLPLLIQLIQSGQLGSLLGGQGGAPGQGMLPNSGMPLAPPTPPMPGPMPPGGMPQWMGRSQI